MQQLVGLSTVGTLTYPRLQLFCIQHDKLTGPRTGEGLREIETKKRKREVGWGYAMKGERE